MKKLTAVLLVFAFVLAAPLMASAQDMLDQRLTKIEEMVKGLKQNQMMGFHLYASLRPHLGYYDTEEEYLGGPAMDPNIGAFNYDDDSGTLLSISGQSRLGAKAVVSKKFYGVLEFGLTETTGEGQQEEFYNRLAYGVWDFGSGKLTVGKNYTPGTFLGYSKMVGDLGDQGDANMLVAGLSYIGRQPLIQLSFGDFEIALIEPNTGADDFSSVPFLDFDSTSPSDTGTLTNPIGWKFDKDFDIPRIELAHVFRLPNVNIRPVLGYQTYDVDIYNKNAGEEFTETIDSYLAGLGVSATFDPAYIKATGTYLQNAGNYGQGNIGLVSKLNAPQDPDGWEDSGLNPFTGTLGKNGFPYAPGLSILNAQYVNGDVEDSTLMQGTLVAGAKVNDMLNLEAGLGYMTAEVDLPALSTALVQAAQGATAEQTAMVGYLQAWFSLTDNVNIIPEIGVVDRGDLEIDGQDDIDCGTMTYFDIDFRLDF